MSIIDYADQLIAELDAATSWPLPREHEAIEACAKGRAIRTGDTKFLAHHAGWDRDRPLVHDPLGRRIATGFADFLFAEDAEFKAPSDTEGEQNRVDHLVEVNNMQARCHRAERIKVSEGEAWWKLHYNPAVADVPLLTFSSRRQVVPLFYGDRALAAAFWSERHREMGRNENGELDSEAPAVVFRHVEVHCDGRIVNVLYRGTEDTLGARVDLTQIPATAAFPEEILFDGLAMLAGRVVNDLDDDDTLGVSEYKPISDLLLALDEAVTISVENTRMTGQDRWVVKGELTDAVGNFDASMQVFQLGQGDGEATFGAPDGTPPVFAIEKTFDAAAIWTQIEKLVKTIVSRVGLVVEFVGDGGEGKAESGTAIRLRFLPTTNAAKGKQREWDRALPHILGLMLELQARVFSAPAPGEGTATVTLSDPIPRDESETNSDVAAAVSAEVMSRETAVKTLHPEWDSGQVQDELARIAADMDALPAAPPPPPPPPPAPEPTPPAAA